MARERINPEQEEIQDPEQIQDPDQEKVQTPEAALQELRENSVPKSDYEKLEKKFNKLFSDVAAGKYAPGTGDNKPTLEERTKRVNQLVNDLSTGKINGPIARTEALCEIDDYFMDTKGKSIFEPSMGNVTKEMQDSADNVRELLDTALEKANGSDSIFVATIKDHLSGPEDVPGSGARRERN